MNSLIDLMAGMSKPSESGKYYHVAISCTPASNIPVYDFLFDRDRLQLDKEVILPYCRNDKIFFGGKTPNQR